MTSQAKATDANWQVTYRFRGQDRVARSNLTHQEACHYATALEREGWKHVNFSRQSKG